MGTWQSCQRIGLIAWAYLLLSVVSVTGAQATQPPTQPQSLQQLFADSFYTEMYEPRFCGKNIMRLVRAANDIGIDLSNAHILQIQNTGFSNFGMVKALNARDAGRIYTEEDKQRLGLHPMAHRWPGHKNWFQHVVLDVGGYVFDFDFTSQPTVMTREQYVASMFVANGLIDSLPARELKDLQDYEVSFIPAPEYIAYLAGDRTVGKPKFSVNLIEYMQSQFPVVGPNSSGTGTIAKLLHKSLNYCKKLLIPNGRSPFDALLEAHH